jgi:hypothetical protein
MRSGIRQLQSLRAELARLGPRHGRMGAMVLDGMSYGLSLKEVPAKFYGKHMHDRKYILVYSLMDIE